MVSQFLVPSSQIRILPSEQPPKDAIQRIRDYINENEFVFEESEYRYAYFLQLVKLIVDQLDVLEVLAIQGKLDHRLLHQVANRYMKAAFDLCNIDKAKKNIETLYLMLFFLARNNGQGAKPKKKRAVRKRKPTLPLAKALPFIPLEQEVFTGVPLCTREEIAEYFNTIWQQSGCTIKELAVSVRLDDGTFSRALSTQLPCACSLQVLNKVAIALQTSVFIHLGLKQAELVYLSFGQLPLFIWSTIEEKHGSVGNFSRAVKKDPRTVLTTIKWQGNPRPSQVNKLLQDLGVSAAVLLGGNEEPQEGEDHES